MWHYGIIGVLENVTADEDLVKQYKEIMNCYKIYSELTVLTNTDNTYGHVSVYDFLFYLLKIYLCVLRHTTAKHCRRLSVILDV